jgi:integrase
MTDDLSIFSGTASAKMITAASKRASFDCIMAIFRKEKSDIAGWRLRSSTAAVAPALQFISLSKPQLFPKERPWSLPKALFGIVNLTFHDLRHTWSSRAAEMGIPEHVRPVTFLDTAQPV